MSVLRGFLLFALLVSSSMAIRCHVDGDCSSGSLITITAAANYSECLNDCRSFPGCNAFSYCESRGCNLFSSCDTISNAGADICDTSDVTCPDQLVCNSKGSCIGQVDFSTAFDYDECLGNCKANPTCSWFTFYPTTKQCTMTQECDFSAIACSDCVIGEQLCPYDANAKKVLMIFGGQSTPNQVKAVDLTGEQRTCELIPNLPSQITYGSAATFINNEATVCGGFGSRTKNCFAMSRGTDNTISWQQREDMLDIREFTGSAMFDDKTWFITGGYDQNSGQFLTSTEFKVAGSGTSARANLPQGNQLYDLVALSDNEAVILGGSNFGSTVYHYDRDDNTWDSNTIPKLPSPLDNNVQAGLAIDKDGKRTLVALDRQDSFKLALDDPFGVWLPASRPQNGITTVGATIPYENSFLLLDGGFIYKYDPDTELFQLRQETYSPGNDDYISVALVPNYYINCQL